MRKVFVHKLGGSNLMLALNEFENQLDLIFKEAGSDSIIFVVSALAGVTRLLDSIFIAMRQKDRNSINSLLGVLKEIHYKRAKDLNVDCVLVLEKYFSQIELFINKSSQTENETIDQAALLKYGELLSSSIFQCFLGKGRLIDARSFMVSSPFGSSHIEAQVVIEPTIDNIFRAMNCSKIIVTQGFISRDYDSGDDNVLGYDGSDLTAAVISLSLLVKSCWVSLNYWKDVSGVLVNMNNKNKIFLKMFIKEYLRFSTNNSVPVRPDAIETLSFFARQDNFEGKIRPFKKPKEQGTVLTV